MLNYSPPLGEGLGERVKPEESQKSADFAILRCAQDDKINVIADSEADPQSHS